MQYRKEVGGDVISDVLPDTPVTVGFRHGLQALACQQAHVLVVVADQDFCSVAWLFGV